MRCYELTCLIRGLHGQPKCFYRLQNRYCSMLDTSCEVSSMLQSLFCSM